LPVPSYKNPASRKIYEGYINNLKSLPISFTYNCIDYRGFDGDIFTQLKKTTVREGEKEKNVFTLKADDNLTITVETAYYDNYGAYEWTVWF